MSKQSCHLSSVRLNTRCSIAGVIVYTAAEMRSRRCYKSLIFTLFTWILMWPHAKMSKGVRSRERAAQNCDITVLCEPLQRTHLQRPLLRMSPTAWDETSRGRNPENGSRRDFGRRRHRLSGFQHTYRPRPSSPEMFNKDHNAGRENLSHINLRHIKINLKS